MAVLSTIIKRAFTLILLISVSEISAQKTTPRLFYSIDAGTTIVPDMGAALRTGASVYGFNRHMADISGLYIPGYGSTGYAVGGEAGYYFHFAAFHSSPLNFYSGISFCYLKSRQVIVPNALTYSFVHLETRFADARLNTGFAYHCHGVRLSFTAQFLPFIMRQKFRDNMRYPETTYHRPGTYEKLMPVAVGAGISVFVP